MAIQTQNNKSLGLLVAGFFLAMLFLYVFGLGNVGVFDVREARTVQISSESTSLHDAVITPSFLGKPATSEQSAPVVHGVQYMATRFLGENLFSLRLPSALAMFLLVAVFV